MGRDHPGPGPGASGAHRPVVPVGGARTGRDRRAGGDGGRLLGVVGPSTRGGGGAGGRRRRLTDSAADVGHRSALGIRCRRPGHRDCACRARADGRCRAGRQGRPRSGRARDRAGRRSRARPAAARRPCRRRGLGGRRRHPAPGGRVGQPRPDPGRRGTGRRRAAGRACALRAARWRAHPTGTPQGNPLGSGQVSIDLNTATASALEGLPGVGPVLAGRIVEWRAANGSFRSVEELGEVSGIGDAVLSQVRGLVRV